MTVSRSGSTGRASGSGSEERIASSASPASTTSRTGASSSARASRPFSLSATVYSRSIGTRREDVEGSRRGSSIRRTPSS